MTNWLFFWAAFAVACVAAQFLTWYSAAPAYGYVVASLIQSGAWVALSAVMLAGAFCCLALNLVMPLLWVSGLVSAARCGDLAKPVQAVPGYAAAVVWALGLLAAGLAGLLGLIMYLRFGVSFSSSLPWATLAAMLWCVVALVVCYSFLWRRPE